LYSPYTGKSLISNGKTNARDPSLVYVYIEETGGFEYLRKGYEHLKALETPELGDDSIDLVVEIDDGITGGDAFVGYRATWSSAKS